MLLGTAALATRFGWVRQPRSMELIWRLALLSGVLTASATLWVLPAVGPGPAVDRRVTVEAEVVAPSPECVALLRSGFMGGGAPIRALRATCGPTPRLEWYHLLTLLWFSGMAVALERLWRARRAWRSVEATLSLAPSNPTALLAELLDVGSLRGVRLYTSTALDAPCVTPSAAIALPERCVDDLEAEELRAVLAHEVAHIARRDVRTLAAARFLAGLLWIQPFNRLAIAGISEAAELACDDLAVRLTGQPLGLARSIAKVAEWTVPRTRRGFAVAIVGRRGRSLVGRVRRILSANEVESEVPHWRRVLTAGALLAPLLAVPAVPMPEAPRTVVLVRTESGEAVVPHGGFEVAPGEVAEIRIRVSP